MVKEVTISNTALEKINYTLLPGTLEFIIQKVQMLITTIRGSLALNRDYGLSSEYTDKPMTLVYPALRYDIGTQIKKWIPEVEFKELFLESVEDGKMYFKIKVEVNL